MRRVVGVGGSEGGSGGPEECLIVLNTMRFFSSFGHKGLSKLLGNKNFLLAKTHTKSTT